MNTPHERTTSVLIIASFENKLRARAYSRDILLNTTEPKSSGSPFLQLLLGNMVIHDILL